MKVYDEFVEIMGPCAADYMEEKYQALLEERRIRCKVAQGTASLLERTLYKLNSYRPVEDYKPAYHTDLYYYLETRQLEDAGVIDP